MIEGKTQAENQYVYAEEDVAIPLRSVRDLRYKLVLNLWTGKEQLFDEEQDPKELTNVAQEHPEVVKELSARLQEWMKQNTPPKAVVLRRWRIFTAPEQVAIVDDQTIGGRMLITGGGWHSDTNPASGNFDGGCFWAEQGNGSRTAVWRNDDPMLGTYKVSVYYGHPAIGRLATDAPFTIVYGPPALGRVAAPNPQGPIVGLPDLKGMIGWLGQGISNQLETDENNFAPRFGFAYLLNQKTVIRGGYGVYYQPRIIRGFGGGAGGAIEASRNTDVVGTVDGVTPATSLSNPFPTGFLFPVNDKNPLASEGSSIALPLRQYRTGYVQLWSLDIQRGLPRQILLGLDYNGNKGTKLITGPWNLNQLPDQYLALGSKLNTLVPNPFYGVITQGGLAGPQISLEQSLLPYPDYTGISQVNVPAGDSIYHAFSARVEKRAAKGLAFLASYTWSKAIDNIGAPLDMENRQNERALSSFDVPQRLVFSWTYQLPFGRGQSLGAHWNPVVNGILGNWDFNGIMTLSEGQPVSISRPSVNDGQSASLSNPTVARWFNTAVFSPAAPFTFGDVGPDLPDVRQDGLKNIDLVLVKNFPFAIHDHAGRVEFRAEFFNALNHPWFAAPNGAVTSPSFGAASNVNNTPRDIQFGLKLIF